MPDVYEQFIAAVREIARIESIAGILDWDSETYMPPRGIADRAEQLSYLASLAHEKRTDPRFSEWLHKLDDHDADPDRATNLREFRRAFQRAVRVPPDLVGRIARVSAIAKDAWAKARTADAFDQFAPHLAELVRLQREVADRIGYPDEPYDALLDEYEPGLTTKQVAALFESLREPLSGFVKQLADAPQRPDNAILTRHYPVEDQARFCRKLVEAIGFDFQRGRIDVSKHPFCAGSTPTDVRLTTRYEENWLSMAVFGTLHEAGHGLYEQGLPEQHALTPRGEAASLGFHESQSRLWENLVGRSRAFWECYYDDCCKTFPQALGDVSLDAFHAAVNTVEPSLIRIEADEVTYNLHIILRFELERALIDGRLAVNDVPEAWNTRTHALLGISPPNNRDGCLQDIHWSMGVLGYFPTYALGNLYAAQLYVTAERQLGDLPDQIRRGDFAPLLGWLRDNIHQYGRRFRPADLVERVTGRPLSIEPFLEYVRARFSPLYGLT